MEGKESDKEAYVMFKYQTKVQQSKQKTDFLQLQILHTLSAVCKSEIKKSKNQMLVGNILKDLGHGITWLFF